MRKSIFFAVVAAFLAVLLVLAVQWRVRSERSGTGPDRAPQDRAANVRTGAGVAQNASPLEPSPAAAQGAAEAPSEPAAPKEDFETLVGRIDPSLSGRNVIQRAGDPASDGAKLDEVEAQFSAESVDASWSDGMEARILAQVAQIPNLGLASIEVECRQTICRVKLFYPPGTNALSSLEKLRPIAHAIGFAHVVEVATLGEEGVPISLLYFQKDDA